MSLRMHRIEERAWAGLTGEERRLLPELTRRFSALVRRELALTAEPDLRKKPLPLRHKIHLAAAFAAPCRRTGGCFCFLRVFWAGVWIFSDFLQKPFRFGCDTKAIESKTAFDAQNSRQQGRPQGPPAKPSTQN